MRNRRDKCINTLDPLHLNQRILNRKRFECEAAPLLPDNVILSEAKNLWKILEVGPIEKQPGMFRS
ncbi:MAG: hypothetical protein J2P56_05870, partial [Verrucomicrobia bacterium]|nr:hypothetical protein [Verrucomicrobiota bacterium]